MPAWERDPFAHWTEPQTPELLSEQIRQELAALAEQRAWLAEYLERLGVRT